MITYQRETLFDVIADIEQLLKLHYEELTLHKEVVKLAPQWVKYRALEDLGMFKVYTARDDDRLIGYAAFFVSTHMHYEDLMHANNDVLFLHPDQRDKSFGLQLIQFCESELKQFGAHKITWHIKFDRMKEGVLQRHDFRPLMHRLGYIDEEVCVAKIL